MLDLPIRNCDKEAERALCIRAAQNGRNRQMEALGIPRATLLDGPKSWVELIRENAESVGGMEFELPMRHSPRLNAVEFRS